jgi:hypothetical protein
VTTDATPTEGPQTRTQRLLAAANIQMHIASNWSTSQQPEYVDFRTPGIGHFVLEVVTTSDTAARRIAAAIPEVVWECAADFRPGPQHDVMAWEGASMTWWGGPVPVRVVAVLDKRRLPPVTHHWERDDDRAWKARELAAHPEAADRFDAAIDLVHRLVLAGVAS